MAWKNQSNFQRNNITTNFPDLTLNNVIVTSDLSNLDISNILVVHGDISCNNYYVDNVTTIDNLSIDIDSLTNNFYVENDISTNNLYVPNDISLNKLHVVNDISTNNLYVENDISTNNLYVENDISTNNLYVANDISTNNLYVENDLSTNNLYVENAIMNNLDDTNDDNIFLYNISDLSVNNLIINNDISFNSDKISIISQENGITNKRKLKISNDGSFCVLNEDNNKIYDFTNGFLIKPIIFSLNIPADFGTGEVWYIDEDSNITFNKITGKDLNITFFNKSEINGSGTDTISSKLEIYTSSTLLLTINWGEVLYAGAHGARRTMAINNLNAVTNDSNVRNATSITLKVYFKSAGDPGSLDDVTIENGQWLITSF